MEFGLLRWEEEEKEYAQAASKDCASLLERVVVQARSISGDERSGRSSSGKVGTTIHRS
jgi:hypothetical protein